MMNATVHASRGRKNRSAMNCDAGEMKSMKGVDDQQGCTDREKSRQSSDPEMTPKGEAGGQPVLAPFPVLNPAHNQGGQASEDKNRAVAKHCHNRGKRRNSSHLQPVVQQEVSDQPDGEINRGNKARHDCEKR